MAQAADNYDDLLAGVGEPELQKWRTEPITGDERMIVQNLFDNNPKRRAAYLKKIGFEMNPKDDNQIRPLGANTPWDQAGEIDPGFVKQFAKGNITGILKDAGHDVADGFFDTTGGLLQAGGATAGGIVGSLAGPVVGTAAGAIAGGAAGNAINESVKGFLGNQVLDDQSIANRSYRFMHDLFDGQHGDKAKQTFIKEAGDIALSDQVPVDKTNIAIQSLLAGVGGKLIGSASKFAGDKIVNGMKAAKVAIVNAAEQAGNGVNAKLLTKAAADPGAWSKEAVDGANQRLTNTYKSIFGIDESNVAPTAGFKNLPKDSVLGKVINPLNEQAKEQTARLDTSKMADWNVGELLSTFDRTLDKLGTTSQRDSGTQAAYKYLKDKRQAVIADFVKDNADPSTINIPYSAGRKILSSIQDEGFVKDSAAAPWIKANAGDLRRMADAKAKQAYDSGEVFLPNGQLSLPEINAQRSKILSTYDEIRPALTTVKLKQAFLGDGVAHTKSETQLALKKLDDVAGTNLSQQVETGALQAAVESAYKDPKAYGSGDLNQQMMMKGNELADKYGKRGAALGGSAGAAMAGPAGAALGTGIGYVAGQSYGQSKGRALAASVADIPSTLAAVANKDSAIQATQRALQMATDSGIPQVAGAMTAQGLAGLKQSSGEDDYADLLDGVK